ncbi:uncharacterized protein LOC110978601 [Acanthaster planci]|uniref:Uncharacterized protein LOC110978601 n=1 Tax=Acanthaster planci TaxID=133434 RepID=A0A8B7Y862_ACAPL|nr:uncharacterized protein LOC110978601 [Acanthaster planci]XP_022089414.1 uncharacterized protein LOC110978601 [Acanthaster planci]
MMATEMAVGFGQGMSAASFGHNFPLHPHHPMGGYDYYAQPRNYQDHVMMGHRQQQDEEEEDIEDEDIDEESENESMYTSADMDSEIASEDLAEPEPNVAEQLLEFAEAVNRDIQKYFGRKKSAHEPESVGTLYEDRFASGKSGRELYYADLLRVAQNGDAAEPYTTGRSRRTDSSVSPRTSTSSASTENADVTNANYSCKKGLGPLKELFDFAIGGCVDSVNNDRHGGQWQRQGSSQKCLQTLPWRKRALPSSFFMEPGARDQSRTGGAGNVGYGPHVTMITEHETPDFSDLVANFTSDYDSQITATTISH